MYELEREIEKDIVADAEAAGWWQVKLMRMSKRGLPDRLFVRRGRFVFLEVKRVGEEPSRQQTNRHNELKEHGVECYWVDSREAARVILS